MVMSEFDTKEYLSKLNKYWNASNYLSASQLYLLDNPLLKKSLNLLFILYHSLYY